MKKNKDVYLDGAANTPLDRKVYKAMKPYLKHSFVGNSAAIHNHGIKAYRKLEECRKVIADCFKVDKSGVYFTSGATESNNWVINSLAFNEMKKPNGKKHIIFSLDTTKRAGERLSIDTTKSYEEIQNSQSPKRKEIVEKIREVLSTVDQIYQGQLLEKIGTNKNDKTAINVIDTCAKYSEPLWHIKTIAKGNITSKLISLHTK